MMKKILFVLMVVVLTFALAGCDDVTPEEQEIINAEAIEHGWIPEEGYTPTRWDITRTPVSDASKFASIEDIPDRSIIILYDFSSSTFKEKYRDLNTNINRRLNTMAVEPDVLWIPTASEIGQEIAKASNTIVDNSIVTWNNPNDTQVVSLYSHLASEATGQAFDALSFS